MQSETGSIISGLESDAPSAAFKKKRLSSWTAFSQNTILLSHFYFTLSKPAVFPESRERQFY
jgi:hypothetical protein